MAKKILELGTSSRGRIVVLARTKNLLTSLKKTLDDNSIKSVIVIRRDAFASAGFTWMEAVLRQVTRPQDERNIAVISGAFQHLGGKDVSIEFLLDQTSSTGKSLLASWVEAVSDATTLLPLVALTKKLIDRPNDWKTFYRSCLEFWKTLYPDGFPLDMEEDVQAWKEIVKEINLALGNDAALDEFLHRLDISSKEPTPAPDAIRLMTIHGAKGKEFENVFLIGLVEGELPSWQSLKAAAEGEIEEERRNCFVAVTRTEERLYLSYADKYRGYAKQRSRFLDEMAIPA